MSKGISVKLKFKKKYSGKPKEPKPIYLHDFYLKKIVVQNTQTKIIKLKRKKRLACQGKIYTT